MLNADRINEIHRLYHGEHWSVRKIARQLHLARKILRKYLYSPVQAPTHRSRTTKIDPFKSTVASLLEQDPRASSVVILQRLRSLGYEGGITILRACVSQLRSPVHLPRAFVQMEPGPAERFEVDWSHFGALDYAGDKRKLYAFCLVDGHSRMLYVEFTHTPAFNAPHDSYIERVIRLHLEPFVSGVLVLHNHAFTSGQALGIVDDGAIELHRVTGLGHGGDNMEMFVE